MVFYVVDPFDDIGIPRGASTIVLRLEETDEAEEGSNAEGLAVVLDL